MNPTATKVKRFLAEIEATAETILADKEQLVELDRRRQKNREALRSGPLCRSVSFAELLTAVDSPCTSLCFLEPLRSYSVDTPFSGMSRGCHHLVA